MKKLDIEKFLGKVLELLSKHSPSELSYSAISRFTQVPRSTLYYYFGKDQSKLLEEAVQHGIKTFMQLYEFDDDMSRFESWQDFQQSRIHEALILVGNKPWAPGLYFRYRHHPGKWGQLIRDAEDLYCAKLSQCWQRFYEKEPDPLSIRLICYLKLGLLWGVAAERESWFSKEKKEDAMSQLSSQITEWITPCLKTRFE